MELQELVLMLVKDNYSASGTKPPATVPLAGSMAGTPEGRESLGGSCGWPAGGTSCHSVSLSLSKEISQGSSPASVEPSPAGPPAEPSPTTNPTALKIMQLLRDMQNCKEQAGLGPVPCSPCIPFFYKADENDQVKITMI